jgi:hypothetical protein
MQVHQSIELCLPIEVSPNIFGLAFSFHANPKRQIPFILSGRLRFVFPVAE